MIDQIYYVAFPYGGVTDLILDGSEQQGGTFSTLLDSKNKNDFSVLYLFKKQTNKERKKQRHSMKFTKAVPSALA